ncbi:MAG: DUF523 domain-containing protein [Candidatus Hodarchaeales archaeon]
MKNNRELDHGTPVLLSACLYGVPCRYDGKSKPDKRVVYSVNKGKFIPIFICPEQQGGQTTPRPDAELVDGDGRELVDEIGEVTRKTISECNSQVRVLEKDGNDVTKQFLEGARIALALGRASGCSIAILKSRSPSCGTERIYNGTFNKKTIPGMGVTAALLQKHGFDVYNEKNCPFLL